MIVQQLNEIQERLGWLPPDELRALSKRSRIPLYRLNEVASFFPHYRLKAPPKVDVRVCRDMACHLAGAGRLKETLEAVARDQGGDEWVKVEGVSCLGQCDFAPALLINDHVIWGKTDAELRTLVRNAVHQRTHADEHPATSRDPLGWRIDPYDGHPRYEAVGLFVDEELAPDEIIARLKESGLIGMGGAGFPTHAKWKTVREAPGDEKYVVCNADESEPGTFKDRELLRRAPHLLIEGMTLAGLLTGARKGYIYVRHEFHDEIAAVRDALADAYERRVLGPNILGTQYSFDLEIFISPGGYICGEETALLEAMEDRRAEPRNKPPFPVFSGYLGKPTVLNNVETLCWAPAILLKGGKWYAQQGTNGGNGLRFVSISGDVVKPGVYEVPFGQTVRELVMETAGGIKGRAKLKAIAPSGPSGGFLPTRIKRSTIPKPENADKWFKPGADEYDLLDLPLFPRALQEFGSMLGAAFVVISDQRDIVDFALNCVQFYRNESCGKCVPCRMGSQKLVMMIEQILGRKFPRENLPAIEDLRHAMEKASICGLGQVAANPITTVIKYFPDDLEKYLGRGGR